MCSGELLTGNLRGSLSIALPFMPPLVDRKRTQNQEERSLRLSLKFEATLKNEDQIALEKQVIEAHSSQKMVQNVLNFPFSPILPVPEDLMAVGGSSVLNPSKDVILRDNLTPVKSHVEVDELTSEKAQAILSIFKENQASFSPGSHLDFLIQPKSLSAIDVIEIEPEVIAANRAIASFESTQLVA